MSKCCVDPRGTVGRSTVTVMVMVTVTVTVMVTAGRARAAVGSSAGAGGGSSSGGSFSSAGSSAGGASSAGTGFGGFGGGTPGVCGDSMWGGEEQCDDGNATSGDGCSSLCQLEPNYSCNYLGEPCEPVVCGDGLQHSYVQPDGTYAYEVCDDGNAASGDGCSSVCDQEPGWICDQPGTACREPLCGDGRQDSWFIPGPDGGTGGSGSGSGGSGFAGSAGGPGGTFYYEECDDGNAASGDGCTGACTIEFGWICSEPGVACRQPVCGDGFVDFIPQEGGGGSSGSSSGGSGGANAGTGFGGSAGSSPNGFFEGCDDGGTVPGDGCDSTCSVEAGWSCPYWAGPCHVIVCGDGWADWPDEECDDANNIPNDGCTSCISDYSGSGGSSGAGGFASGGTGGFGG